MKTSAFWLGADCGRNQGQKRGADFEILSTKLWLSIPPRLLTQLLNFDFPAPKQDSDTCWPPLVTLDQ